MVTEMLQKGETLTDREIEILESLDDWRGDYTERQRNLIEVFYKRRM